ncbi:peptidyl-tRNA hydrolase-domain-containing protein [Clohesyomyces aquaticus]|uniref:peptidyl-tRNA hydrolase n=1 Tax=Clohesyomyces aquaticus TaxID=1231657 RepID=A0A1Y1ZI63_9PLEO|nr:peptidyl-tRNA hydrolase-domain-containing protein [Clohesyomyces aquaticus]
MANTQTRAHVASPTPTSDPKTKNFTNPSEPHDDESAIEVAPPTSRKEKRKQRKQTSQPTTASQTTPQNSSAQFLKPTAPPNHPPKSRKPQPSALAIMPPLSIPGLTSATTSLYKHPILVCSLGNPGSTYANTLHSAGHYILSHIREMRLYYGWQSGLSGLVARPKSDMFHSFSPIRGYQRTGDTSAPAENFVLWQSTTLMNVCGKSVQKAWDGFRREMAGNGVEPRLVIVHDELESKLGAVSVRDGMSSARGHNGVKSVQASLSKGVKFWRIGVGIGRPESRDPSVVAKYVLRKFTYNEEKALRYAASEVLERIREISEGKKYPG